MAKFEFNSAVQPKALTKENIDLITNTLAKEIAAEAALALEAGATGSELGFHIRIGGGHSRSFSKTSDHKNVYHSRTIAGGGADGPF